ncbi:hypothetical protein Gotri_026224 [Gossypium trilobum]|uniref:CCHC-type domain-containing protein n=1 Tax=Gossypium trilobum TaxID=34281 RepID=A0A7J9FLS2_9ROSI|nr:hypothetical protein [Gossypium trilobum]
MVWVRLPGISGLFYKQKNLEETGGLISKVAKHDFQTNTGARGKFIRMEVFFDMGNPLISKIFVDGKLQKVEFESLPSVCFTCGKSSHVQESCPVAGLKLVDGVAASPSLYNWDYKPDIVDLLETRVSGDKANSIIASLGFQCSHQVEIVENGELSERFYNRRFQGMVGLGWI